MELDLHANMLTGSIAPSIGNLMNLELLNLKDNYLTGKIPVEITFLVELTELKLEMNRFTGTLPGSIGDLVNLEQLFISQNDDINGTVPASIGNLALLQELSLHTMSLSGALPESWPAKLLHLRLDSNYLNGTLPGALATLTDLTYLDLRDNYLHGTLHTELGALTNAGKSFASLLLTCRLSNFATLRVLTLFLVFTAIFRTCFA